MDIKSKTTRAQSTTRQLLTRLVDDDRVDVEDAASELGVSSSTIRNWIKTKYLRVDHAGHIFRDSIAEFQSNVAGIEKLTKRANKSLVDSHDHVEIQTEILAALASHERSDGADLSRRYEESLSNSFRNKEGVYYTPRDIAIQFFSQLPNDVSHLTFCDPCCGTGNFLLAAIEHGFAPENLFGFDTDPTAIEIARHRIAAKTGITPRNLVVADFLDFSCQRKSDDGIPPFDVIFTNPPWGKKLSKRDKTQRAGILGTGKAMDTSALFFFASFRVIKHGGYLGFLLPEAFFNIATFQAAREKALACQILELFDFGRPFKTLFTRAKGFVLRVDAAEKDRSIRCTLAGSSHSLPQSQFANNPKSIINFSMNENEANVLSHIFRFPYITLADNARWGLGIVTGNNSRFTSNVMKPGHVPVFRGSDIFTDRIADPTAFIPLDLSLYQQVAPIELYHAKKKLLYRFISSELVFFCDSQQRLVLNSANMLILNEDFGFKAETLAHYLSSRFMNWIFKTLFQTHKVLRSDLEQLPLFTEYLSRTHEFCETAMLGYLGMESDRNGSFRVKK